MRSARSIKDEASVLRVRPIELDAGDAPPSAAGKDLRQHPLSAAFPPMAEEDYLALKDSIESIGIQNPITLFDNMVLDGWHRWRAANELGLDCPKQELGDFDPRDFVLAQNKVRRHVTAAQMAMATTAVYRWSPVGANQHGGSTLSVDPAKSTAELAVIAGVHENTITQAKAVHANAAPEVQAAVKSGEIGLPKAAAIAKLPKGEQAAAIKKPLAKKPQVPKPIEPAIRLAQQIEAEQIAADAHGDTNLADLLTETQKDLEAAQRQIAAMSADDQKAETAKWQRLADIAERRKNEVQKTLVEREAEIKRHVDALRRIGRAVGEEDPKHVAAAVELLVRHAQVAT